MTATSWTFRANNTAFNATTATAAGSTVSGASTSAGADAGPNVADYTATPADVISLPGTPAAAFADFPIGVV